MKLTGILPALVTPFDANGETDFKTLERLVEHLLAKGVHGFVPMGSTGEYYAMTDDERVDVLRCVMDVAGKRGQMIAGTNAGSTRAVIKHTEAAKKLGYDTVLLPPPYYSLPTQDELLAHYQAVLDAVDVEIVLYNFPLRAGVEVGFGVMDALADNPRVIAIKESSGNLLRALEIDRRYRGRYALSCGSDDQAFDFFLWGATSWICGPANCLVEPVVKFYNAFTGGDRETAQRVMRAIYPAMTNLESGKFVQKVKFGCQLMGIPVGETRRPLLPLNADEKRELEAALSAANARASERPAMRWPRSLDLLLVHCQGEIGKVIMDGAPGDPGATALEQMTHINTVDDSLRRFVAFEPRAGAQMSTNLLIPPTRPDADAGFIVLQADRAHAMSGSNCICVVTALLESDRVAMIEPETILRLDTPAGLITARARCAGGRCLSVSLENVPAFVEALDHPVETPLWGRIKADIAFGGIYYAIVDASEIGVAIEPGNARALAEAGIEIKRLLAEQVSVRHPEMPGLNEIAYVMFRSPEPDGAIRTCTTLKPGRVDRSPCGTGSSANLAVLHARGLVKVGDTRRSRSIIGGEFLVEAIGETTIGNRPAVLPRITGQAWIYGSETLRMDDSDPFPQGFALSDTWGSQVDQLG